ncbi:MAG: NAD(P)-dependent oxidoreductase [Bacteroidota bacterium]
MNKVLITGASGFIGGYIVEACLAESFEVYAAVRASSSRTYLQDERIQFLLIDLSDVEAMTQQFKHHAFDYVIHNAGVTKAADRKGYFKVNTNYTENLVRALQAAGHPLKKLVFISSLAAYGPVDGKAEGEDMVMENDLPRPVTMYGESKLAAEQFLKEQADLPYVILRPTAVYGPREKDLLSFFKLLAKGLEPYIGFAKQQLTFIYVKDLARLIVTALTSKQQGRSYFVADGKSYSAQDLGRLGKTFLQQRTFKFHLPLALVRVVALVTEKVAAINGRYPALNLEKVKELESLNWKCDIRPLQEELGFKAQYDLEQGLKETINWYRDHQWI